MFCTSDIIQNLENNRDTYSSRFILLSNETDQLLDTRLNVFRHPTGRWTLAFEKLVFDPIENMILLEIYYYGNCVQHLYQERNFFEMMMVDHESLNATTRGLLLKPGAESWLVGDRVIYLTHRREKYLGAGIMLEHADCISTVEAARYLVATKRKHFRASKEQLYLCLPDDLERILVLDEWHHQDYHQNYVLDWSEAEVMDTLTLMGEEWRFGTFTHEALRSMLNSVLNQEERVLYSPSTYETWPMIAEVIVTGDVSYYAPTLEPNTHWSNWPAGFEL
jgi:hypothetical protein